MPPEFRDPIEPTKTNPHYVIAGILCVIGLALSLTMALAFIGVPLLLVSFVWFGAARYAARPKPQRDRL